MLFDRFVGRQTSDATLFSDLRTPAAQVHAEMPRVEVHCKDVCQGRELQETRLKISVIVGVFWSPSSAKRSNILIEDTVLYFSLSRPATRALLLLFDVRPNLIYSELFSRGFFLNISLLKGIPRHVQRLSLFSNHCFKRPRAVESAHAYRSLQICTHCFFFFYAYVIRLTAGVARRFLNTNARREWILFWPHKNWREAV
jgi:hypothetical protein